MSATYTINTDDSQEQAITAAREAVNANAQEWGGTTFDTNDAYIQAVVTGAIKSYADNYGVQLS